MSVDTGPSSTIAAMVASNPVTYVAANMQSVIDDDTDYSDSEDSNEASDCSQLLCAVMSSNTEILGSATQQVKWKVGAVPFFEPHLWWCCLTGASDFLPQTINALINPGSRTVLIHEDLVNTLLLCHCTLHKHKTIELAMEMNGEKKKDCVMGICDCMTLQTIGNHGQCM